MTKKKPKHGGARNGAGRKSKEPTVVIRVPVSCVKEINAVIQKSKN